MSAETKGQIARSISISTAALLSAWLLVLVLPVVGSLLALDFFLAEYSVFAEPEQMAIARQNIDECRNLLVIENHLEAKLPELENLILPADAQNLQRLQAAIDAKIFGNGLLYVFLDNQSGQLTPCRFSPPDLKRQMPPLALFRKLIQNLAAENYLTRTTGAQSEGQEKLRNSLQVQQMFKTMTSVNIRPGQVSMNLSVDFGGELYFTWFEFRQPQAGQKGCLAVIRGRDLSFAAIYNDIKKTHPGFRLKEKKINIQKARLMPLAFFSGITRLADRLIITSPADQRFVRSWLHKCAIMLNQREKDFAVPFIEYHLPTSVFQHDFQALRKNIGMFARFVLMLSLVQLMHMLTFGINLDISFKRRILASVMLVSLFPFAFLGIGFYLHQQYDRFLAHQNLLLHVEIRLTQLGNELKQYMETLEKTLIAFGKKVDPALFNDPAATGRFFDMIGRQMPVTALAMHRPEESQIVEFPDRTSPGNQNSTLSMIERFLPRHAIDLLLEPEPIFNRTRQDILMIAGNPIRNASIAQSMMTNGQLYYVDQTSSVIWYSMYKLYTRNKDATSLMGILGGKFEPGPILASFTAQTSLAQSSFTENYGGFSVKYAFFPTERTGAGRTWAGSGYVNEPLMKKASRTDSSQTTVLSEGNAVRGYLISRYNHNVPHVVVAMVTAADAAGGWATTAAGLFIYLLVVFYLVSQLLEYFFVHPVRELARSAEQIARGKDVWNLELTSGDEFESLNMAFSELVVGLQQRNMLSDYVSEDAISQIEMSQEQGMAPGGEYLEATIIFAALKNYAQLTAGFTPEQTVELINLFITCGDQLVKKHGGTIDKIIDSTLMLVFRENEEQTESHALRAARTALELAAEMRRHNLDIYAGIASGTVISGRIGSYTGKLDFTVIGDQVNLAARLKNEAIESSSGLIISGSTMRLLKGKGRVNFLRRCSLKGKAREYNIYELYELRD